MNTRRVGALGEDIAVKYLVKHGFKILARNFTCHFGEVDIVAMEKDTVVFVEVKWRKDESFGKPREAVNWRKQQTIIKCANYWLYKNEKVGLPVRFDVMEIMGSELVFLRDAFRP